MSNKLYSLLKLTRPLGWIPFLIPLILGIYDAFVINFSSIDILKIISGILVYGPIGAGSQYALNFYFDRNLDKENKLRIPAKDLKIADQPFSSGSISENEGKAFIMILIIAGLTISWSISTMFFLITALCALLGIAYSTPPLRFKSRPFLDIFANIACCFLSYVAGWVIFRSLTELQIFKPLLLSLLVGSGYIITTVVDIEIDRKNNVMSTSAYLGIKNVAFFGLVLLMMSYLALMAVFVQVSEKIDIVFIAIIFFVYPVILFIYNIVYDISSIRKKGGVFRYIGLTHFVFMYLIYIVASVVYSRYSLELVNMIYPLGILIYPIIFIGYYRFYRIANIEKALNMSEQATVIIPMLFIIFLVIQLI